MNILSRIRDIRPRVKYMMSRIRDYRPMSVKKMKFCCGTEMGSGDMMLLVCGCSWKYEYFSIINSKSLTKLFLV